MGTLYGYAAFHLNLMFSSIEEEQRPEVIARCYGPLLDLAESGILIGIEATGLTLEIAHAIAPQWTARLKRLIAAGQVEFIGSGYAQAIGPLMPWRVVQKNLALGQLVYDRLLGVRPAIALVNEQAWSGGLVPLYVQAGYRALIMDWDDPAAHHPEWSRHWRYHPQRARGADGSEVALLWSNTIAFQKLQRLAHGEIDSDDYVEFVLGARAPVDRVLALYTNDAECFDFRPGRYADEAAPSVGEWTRVAGAFRALAERGVRLVLPSAALAVARGPNANQLLTLEAPSNPVPVKKQPKYNLTRWSSSGRDDLFANTMCHRAAQTLIGQHEASEEDWRALCRLWSSDFRTHITPRRWAAFQDELNAFVARLQAERPSTAPAIRTSSAFTPRIEHGSRCILIETDALRIALDHRRGLAIDGMGRPHERQIVGCLPHGTIDDIALSADWYSGNVVFEGSSESKVTDLERCSPEIVIDETGAVVLTAAIATPLGPIRKTLTIPPGQPRLEIEMAFDWPNWGRGSLRLGHVTLKPDAFDMAALRYRTQNGGRVAETFDLAGQIVDLGAPVSFLISCRAGVGMTEGWMELHDGVNGIRLEADMASAAVIGLIEHKTVHGQTFCRMMLSGLEMDETRKPDRTRTAPRVFRMAVALTKVNGC